MSTKISIAHGKEYHLYQEIFDASNVYIEVRNHDFTVSNGSAMIQIPIKAWRNMVTGWQQSGWPESDDDSDKQIAEEWGTSLLPVSPKGFESKNSDETIIFKKVQRNEKN